MDRGAKALPVFFRALATQSHSPLLRVCTTPLLFAAIFGGVIYLGYWPKASRLLKSGVGQ